MYMTIGEFHERLGMVLRDHPEIDKNMLLIDANMIDNNMTGDYAIGTCALSVAEKCVNDRFLNPWTIYIRPPYIEKGQQ